MGKPKYASGAYQSPLQNGCLKIFTVTKSHNVIAIGMNCYYFSGSNDGLVVGEVVEYVDYFVFAKCYVFNLVFSIVWWLERK